MEHVSVEQLREWIVQKADLTIINIGPHRDFEKHKIPLSINIPFKDDVVFITEVEKHVKSKDAKIIMHCEDRKDRAAKKAAQKLDRAGFSNVYYLEEGAHGWFTYDDKKI